MREAYKRYLRLRSLASGDEAKKQQRRRPALIAIMLVFALLATYQGSHYAMAAVIFRPGFCCGICVHAIGRRPLPDWAERFFWVADQIDFVIGVEPYRDRMR